MLAALGRAGEQTNRAVAWLFAAVLVWAPLPYASNRPWSWALLAVLAGALLLAWSLAQILGAKRVRVPWVVWVAFLTTALVWGWAWLQTVPVADLPAWFADKANPVWTDAAAAGLKVQPTMGLDAAAGRDALMKLVTYAVMFALAFALAQESERARAGYALLLVLISVEALYGLINLFAGWNTVLWEDGPKDYAGYVTGTFVNRNSFATYANIAILIGLGFLLEPFMKEGAIGRFGTIVHDTVEKLVGPRLLLLLALVILSAASLLTGSRGGFLSLALAIIVFFLLVLLVSRPRRAVGIGATVAVVLIAIGIFQVSGGVVSERLAATDETLSFRTVIWALTLRAARHRPWLGQGYGNYEAGVAPYKNDEYLLTVDLAHSTYLEHYLELGLPATLLLYAGPVLLFGYCVRGIFVRRRDQMLPLVAASVTVLVAVHSLVDFSLQMPAVAVTYATVLGIGVAQSMRSKSATEDLSRSRPVPEPTRPVAAPVRPRPPRRKRSPAAAGG
ncbi:MAG: O-antigen ligase family protein [Geminicoccaceae bacterium]